MSDHFFFNLRKRPATVAVLFLLHVAIALAIVQRLVAKGLGWLDRSGAVGPVRSRRPRPFATNRYSYIIARSRTKCQEKVFSAFPTKTILTKRCGGSMLDAERKADGRLELALLAIMIE